MIRPKSGKSALLALATIAALFVVCVPRFVRADGAPFPPYGHEADVRMPGQKAILVYDAETGREDLVLSVKLLGGPGAAWVVPIPSLPEVRTASAEWFTYLSDLTKPEIEIEWVTIRDGEVGRPLEEEGGPRGVELLSREQVGAYDVSILSSDKPGALLEWLNEHGYAFPERGEPILDAYVEEEGWYFMAARVLPGESAQLEGDVQPLWLSFDAPQPVYPMRLTALVDRPMDVLLYVLTDHRMEIEGFETEFAGELTLEPVESEEGELADLLTSRSYYCTKLRDESHRASSDKDLYVQRAASDEPYRKVIHHTRFISEYEKSPVKVGRKLRRLRFPVEWAPFCALGVALVVFLAGLGIAWWRRSKQ